MSEITNLPALRTAARTSEEAFEAALLAHYGRDAVIYTRFLPLSALPARLAALAERSRCANDRLIQALCGTPLPAAV